MANFFDLKARQAAAAASSSSKAPTTKQGVNPRLQPWVEKYRPKTLSDVTSQDHTIQVLSRTLSSANLPHMLFYGPPGTGKTSTILALAKQLYGPDLMATRVLELNASDERGINIVREKVKNFARQQLSNPPAGPAGEVYRKKHPVPPFKIIILDEADSMTQDAQGALRRTMETYSRITRFCLVCNYVTRIIDPLASRCSKFRFKSLAAGSAHGRISEIAGLEGVRMEDGVVDALVRCAEGDLRKAITFLQSAARLSGATAPAIELNAAGKKAKGKGSKSKGPDAMDVDTDDEEDGEADANSSASSTAITVSTIEEIAGVVPDRTIDRLVSAIRSSTTTSNYYDPVAAAVRDIVADGWSAAQLVSQLFQRVLYDESIPDVAKGKIALTFSEVDKRLVDGCDEHLTVLDLALRIAQILTSAKT